jgi:hypothetical protein
LRHFLVASSCIFSHFPSACHNGIKRGCLQDLTKCRAPNLWNRRNPMLRKDATRSSFRARKHLSRDELVRPERTEKMRQTQTESWLGSACPRCTEHQRNGGSLCPSSTQEHPRGTGFEAHVSWCMVHRQQWAWRMQGSEATATCVQRGRVCTTRRAQLCGRERSGVR